MADVCSHQDESRKGVSATAHAVAVLRAMEPLRHGDGAWFDDPYAMLLGGDVGRAWVQNRGNQWGKAEGKTEEQIAARAASTHDWMAIRTRKIDEEMLKSINQDGYQQVCLIGAGLCTRAWRLRKTAEHPIAYFEVDFPEIFAWKLSVLSQAGAVSPFDYHNVVADLSLPDWGNSLIGAGFDPTKPTVWLLEGFIGYLKEEEANALFRVLTDTLSAPGSRVIATLGTNRQRSGNDLHCFFPPDPLAWLGTFGWAGQQWEIHDLGRQYGRPLTEEWYNGYYIMVADN